MPILNTALIAQVDAMVSLITRRVLTGTELSESEWTALRIADHLAIAHFDEPLAVALDDRAGVTHGSQLVDDLTQRGYLENDRVSEAHRETVTAIQRRLDAAILPLAGELADNDIDATNRVLREVLNRARVALDRQPLGPPQRATHHEHSGSTSLVSPASLV